MCVLSVMLTWHIHTYEWIMLTWYNLHTWISLWLSLSMWDVFISQCHMSECERLWIWHVAHYHVNMIHIRMIQRIADRVTRPWPTISWLFLKLFQRTRILPMGFMMNPMRILVRLVLNWKFLEKLSRCVPSCLQLAVFRWRWWHGLISECLSHWLMHHIDWCITLWLYLWMYATWIPLRRQVTFIVKHLVTLCHIQLMSHSSYLTFNSIDLNQRAWRVTLCDTSTLTLTWDKCLS